uniref:Solute carrier family 26 member 3 n=1 Tax=Takifugu rubripes TaxID=31033 RepID=A0A674MVE9_TAKRU
MALRGGRMVTFRRQYKVARPVYSEDSFAEHYERTCRQRKTTLDHIREYLTTKNAVLSLLPIIGWLRIYKVKEWLLGDVVSGISTGLVAIMQGLAFSLLASLPPSYGLYTAFFPMLTYFFLGTSRHISVGSFPVLSLMVGAVVTRLVPLDETQANVTNIPGFEGLTLDQKRVLVASSMTFLVGIFQLAMGILQFGFIVVYLSDTLVSGFTTAAAVHILVSQLKFVLGLDVPGISGPLSIIYTLEKVFVQITSTNLCDLVMSIIIMVVVFIVKELNDRYKAKLPVPIPIEVIVTIIACGVSYGFNFNKIYNVDIVGEMVRGYVSVLSAFAFPTAIVGFAVAFSVAKVYSKKHDYIIDGNQEGNFAINLYRTTHEDILPCIPIFSLVCQVAGLISAMMAMIVTLALGFLLEPLPRSVLGALVIVNLKGMLMQFREIPYLWRKDTPDCVVWVATCLSACLLGLDLGLAVGLGVELLTVIFRTQFPRCCLLANIQGTNLYRDRKDYTHIFEPKGVKIFKIPSPLFFANIEFFKEKLREAVGFNPLKILKKRNKALRKVRNLAKKSNYDITENGLWDLISTNDECSKATEELDELSNVEVIPSKWNLPASISFPRVDLHSLILDFSTVSFVDISAVKGLKLVLKEFLHIDVDVYIVSLYVLEKLHNCMFFDTEIQTSVFFPTLHDAVLHVLDKKNLDQRPNRLVRKTFTQVSDRIIYFSDTVRLLQYTLYFHYIFYAVHCI